MTAADENALTEAIDDMKRVSRYGVFIGDGSQRYLNRCRRRLLVGDKLATVIFTRDTGHHTSGWWKNPDYERCLHLSLSFCDAETTEPAPHDHTAASELCAAFFDGMTNLIWAEPPYSEHGKRYDVWHYRVFMAPDFKTPLLPRGEVYSRELTEAGWKSWSDVQAERNPASPPRPLAGHTARHLEDE